MKGFLTWRKTVGEGFAYFRWRTLILQKFGPAYFDTEGGARLTWTIYNAGWLKA